MIRKHEIFEITLKCYSSPKFSYYTRVHVVTSLLTFDLSIKTAIGCGVSNLNQVSLIQPRKVLENSSLSVEYSSTCEKELSHLVYKITSASVRMTLYPLESLQ